MDRRLQPFGLTEATWLPLIYVARVPAPMRQKDLAAALALDGSSVVRLLDALEASGHIERREEGKDRRAKTITVTDPWMVDHRAGRSRLTRGAQRHAARLDGRRTRDRPHGCSTSSARTLRVGRNRTTDVGDGRDSGDSAERTKLCQSAWW